MIVMKWEHELHLVLICPISPKRLTPFSFNEKNLHGDDNNNYYKLQTTHKMGGCMSWGCVLNESSVVCAKNDRAANNCNEKVENIEPQFQINPGHNFVARRLQEAKRIAVAYPLHHDEETSQTSKTDTYHTREYPVVEGGGLIQRNDIDVESAQQLAPSHAITIPVNDGDDTAARGSIDPPLEDTGPSGTISNRPSPIHRDFNSKSETHFHVRKSINKQGDPPGEETHSKSIIITKIKNKDFRF
jgi:hypothetical protein